MFLLIGILDHALLAVIHVGVIAVDVALFMLLAKYLSILCPVSPFTNFAAVGEPIVSPLIAATKRFGNSSYRASLLWMSLVLSITRIFLVTIANSILAA